jgi:hypothetical protein
MSARCKSGIHSRFGPDITMSICPGYRLCSAMFVQVAGVCGSQAVIALRMCAELTPARSIHSMVSPSFSGRGVRLMSPVSPSGSACCQLS